MITKNYPRDPIARTRAVFAEMNAEWEETLRIIKERRQRERQREREKRERRFNSMFPPTGTVAVAW